LGGGVVNHQGLPENWPETTQSCCCAAAVCEERGERESEALD